MPDPADDILRTPIQRTIRALSYIIEKQASGTAPIPAGLRYLKHVLGLKLNPYFLSASIPDTEANPRLSLVRRTTVICSVAERIARDHSEILQLS